MTYPEKITHKELIELGRDWLIKQYVAGEPHGHYGCGVVLTELCAATYAGEQPDVIGFCPKKSILIECKASRSDFYADQNKVFRMLPDMALGSQRWYLAPQGVIPVDKLPEKWGLLEVTANGKIRVAKKAEIQDRNYQSEINLLVSTMKRLNIIPDGHASIKRYTPFDGALASKNRATFYIDSENTEEKQ